MSYAVDERSTATVPVNGSRVLLLGLAYKKNRRRSRITARIIATASGLARKFARRPHLAFDAIDGGSNGDRDAQRRNRRRGRVWSSRRSRPDAIVGRRTILLVPVTASPDRTSSTCEVENS